MKVLKLEIRKHDQYGDDYKDEMVGVVQIAGETGKMEVRLSPLTVSKIFKLCRDDVQKVADYNASQAAQACDVIADTINLAVENGDLKQLEESNGAG